MGGEARGVREHVLQPTDRPCPSQPRDADTLHVSTLPRLATLMCMVMSRTVGVVLIATRPRTRTMGKRKAEEINTLWTVAELHTVISDTYIPLPTCASWSVSPCFHVATSVYPASHFTQTPFHTFFLHEVQHVHTTFWTRLMYA